MSTNPDPQSNNSQILQKLSDEQKHDLMAALLSVKWAADMLQPSDGSEPPCALIAAHLLKSHQHLTPFIEAILAQSEGSIS
jgi:hypothetical protein